MFLAKGFKTLPTYEPVDIYVNGPLSYLESQINNLNPFRYLLRGPYNWPKPVLKVFNILDVINSWMPS